MIQFLDKKSMLRGKNVADYGDDFGDIEKRGNQKEIPSRLFQSNLISVIFTHLTDLTHKSLFGTNNV